MSLVTIHYGIATDLPVTFSERDGSLTNLTGTTIAMFLRTSQFGGYTFTRAGSIVSALVGSAKWTILVADFGAASGGLLFLGTWELWWTVSPPPTGSPGRYPEMTYDQALITL